VQDFEVELIQATLRGGETLSGLVRLLKPGANEVQVSLHGEEQIFPNTLQLQHYVLPFFELQKTLVFGESGVCEFHLPLPKDLPPTYYSQDLRCLYTLKVRRQGPPGFFGFHRDIIYRLNIPVLHPDPEESAKFSLGHVFEINSLGIQLKVHLEQVEVEPGQALRGELFLNRASEVPLPDLIRFRLAAIEELTRDGHFHRKVLAIQTHEVKPEEGMTYPLQALFEFPIHWDTPSSGEWHSFTVHHGFRISLLLPNGQELRESLPIRVVRRTSSIELIE